MSEQTDDLHQVIRTFWQNADRAEAQNDVESARAWMEAIVQLDEKNADAWLRLAGLVSDAQERMYCYVQVLEIDPRNESARAGIRKTRKEVR